MTATQLPPDASDTLQKIAQESFLSLWQGYCDLKQLSRDLMHIVDGECPDCFEKALHSAQLEGKPALSCTECEWASTYERLRGMIP
jgi:hypothetical protein